MKNCWSWSGKFCVNWSMACVLAVSPRCSSDGVGDAGFCGRCAHVAWSSDFRAVRWVARTSPVDCQCRDIGGNVYIA